LLQLCKRAAQDCGRKKTRRPLFREAAGFCRMRNRRLVYLDVVRVADGLLGHVDAQGIASQGAQLLGDIEESIRYLRSIT